MKPTLLFSVGHAANPQVSAIDLTLVAAATRAGWRFDSYHDRRRRGLHFGGGDPSEALEAAGAGSLMAGAHHADQVLWLATGFDLVALGDPASPLWGTLEAAGASTLARSTDPATLYEAAFARLDVPVPTDVVVLDGSPQGPRGLVTAPYLAPEVLAGSPALACDVSVDAATRERLEQVGARTFRGRFVDPERAGRFPGGLDSCDGLVGDDDYAAFTTHLAADQREWARGVLLGGPDLVGAQLPKLARLHLMPLHGQPQVEAIERADALLRRASEPVYGVQYDDRDFFELAERGHGLQVIDPDPPFDAITALDAKPADPPHAGTETEPGDDVLAAWADEGRVLVSLVFWAGMIRELDCITRVLDLVGLTGLRGGLVLTAESVEHGGASALPLLSVPPDRGGAFGMLEPLVGSTGRGVAAESFLPPGALEASLTEATGALADRLPGALAPRGWWPLLDTALEPRRSPIAWRNGKPVLLTIGRNPSVSGTLADASGETVTEGLRSIAYRLRVRDLFGYRRPYDDAQPGRIDTGVADAVRGAGLRYMFTKAGFGAPRVPYRRDAFVAVSFTAGRWDGWSPFYTLGSAADLARAERRLLGSSRPGWLVSTIDTPLWAMSGEVWPHGGRLYELAALAARGGRSGRLVNVTPNVIARYARLLDDRGLSL